MGAAGGKGVARIEETRKTEREKRLRDSRRGMARGEGMGKQRSRGAGTGDEGAEGPRKSKRDARAARGRKLARARSRTAERKGRTAQS